MSSRPIDTSSTAARHSAAIIKTRRARHLFRRRYYVMCWDCELEFGPYRSQVAAARMLVPLWGSLESGRLWCNVTGPRAIP